MVRKPGGVIAAVLCMYGLEQWAQASHPFFVNHGTLINLVTGILVVAALVVKFFRNDLHITRYPRIGLAAVGLYLFAALSFFWDSYRSGWIERMDLMFPYIVTVVFLMPFLVYDIRDLKAGLYYMLIIGGMLAALLALSVNWTYRGVEIQGLYGEKANPLAVASMGAYVCIISALLNFKGVGRFWQVLRWPLLAFGFYLPIVSGSRGQLIALLPTIGVLLPMSRRFSNWKGALATMFGLGMFLVLAYMAYSMFATTERWSPSEMLANYNETRLYSIKVILHEWITGGPVAWVIGLGNSASFDPNVLGKQPHFMVVEVLAEEGLIGFSLVCAVIGLTARAIFRIYEFVKDDPDMRGVLTAATGIFLFELIISCKQGSLLFNTILFGFAIILGRIEMFYREHAGAIYAQQQMVHAAVQQTDERSTPHAGLPGTSQ